MASAHDSKYWGLFENRPAKERTSSPAVEKAFEQRRYEEPESWSCLRRKPRTLAREERVKC